MQIAANNMAQIALIALTGQIQTHWVKMPIMYRTIMAVMLTKAMVVNCW